MEGEKIFNDIEKMVKQYIEDTISDVRVKAAEMFDRNFQRESFFNEKWARRKFNDDDSKNILTGTGALRKSIINKVEGNKIIFETTLPYASIHNEGGTITVTARMKSYFWKMYMQIMGSRNSNGKQPFNSQLQRSQKGELRNNKKNRELTAAAQFYRAMALKPVGSKIVIPKRQFIGNHQELEAAIQEIANNNAIELINKL